MAPRRRLASRSRAAVADAPQLDDFEAADAAAQDGAGLVLRLDGYEGPLHLLLALARVQKVDLTQISVARLAQQYVSFVETAERLRIELAADYLVMAAWLTLLKSRLLLPRDERVDDDDPRTPEEIARALAQRLKRLDAMRNAAALLFEGDLLGRDTVTRGNPEGVRLHRTPAWEADLYDLLKAYGTRRSISARARVRFVAPNVYALETARRDLARRLPPGDAWNALGLLLPRDEDFASNPPPAASRLASGLMATLELARDGRAEVRQDRAFGPVMVRARAQPAPAQPAPAQPAREAAS